MPYETHQMATLTQRGDAWVLQWRDDGRRFRKSVGRVPQEVAARALTELENELARKRMARIAVLQPVGCAPKHTPEECYRLSRNLLQLARKRALRARIRFELAPEHVKHLFEESGGMCQLTGIPFDFEAVSWARWRPWAPSIDRMIPSEGYIPENCRLVCVATNLALNQWGLSVFDRLARGYVQHSRSARVSI